MSKYKNIRTGGYASKREAARAAELQVLEKVGDIRGLRFQVPYILAEANELDKRTVKYIADFVYHQRAPGTETFLEVTEDCKGYRTDTYILKKRWLWEKFGIRIRET